MCDAERRLVANAMLDMGNEWFVLVSESCVPIRSFQEVYRYISESKHSFVGAFDDPGPFGRGRYRPEMSPEVNLTSWRKGAQWFQVDRRLAGLIVSDATYRPKFERFCRPACYVDEHYFPTMLTIEAGPALANRSLTWVDWSRGGPHPGTFGRNDVSEAFFQRRVFAGRNCSYNGKKDETLCFLFARKFAPSALEPLLRISKRVFGY